MSPLKSTSTLRNYPAPSYLLIQDRKTLARQLKAVQNTRLFGIDCETTGLDPHSDRIRLVQIAVPPWNSPDKTGQATIAGLSVQLRAR